jgi:hypothetical protein
MDERESGMPRREPGSRRSLHLAGGVSDEADLEKLNAGIELELQQARSTRGRLDTRMEKIDEETAKVDFEATAYNAKFEELRALRVELDGLLR